MVSAEDAAPVIEDAPAYRDGIQILESYVTHPIVQRLFEVADGDGDGEVDLREFICMLYRLRPDAPPQWLLRLLFQLLDQNGTGFIEREEALQLAPYVSPLFGNQENTAQSHDAWVDLLYVFKKKSFLLLSSN